MLPVLDGQASVGQLGRLWSVVYVGNLVGATLFAGFFVLVGAGVLAGWLMGLLSWLVAAAQESIARVLFVVITTSAIALLHAPHCIAGTVEVGFGLFAGALGLGEVGYFLLFSTSATPSAGPCSSRS